MPDLLRNAQRRAGLLIALSAVLSGCSSAGALFGGGSSPEPTVTASSNPVQAGMDAQGLAVYLELMRRLVDGDAVTQAEAFREVAEAAELAPTTTNRLKLALALATPGHAASDAVQAERQLSGLLVAGDALLPEERVLVTIHLKDVEQRLILDAVAEQLRQEAEAELARQNTESAERLQAVLDENQRLRAQLEEATATLEALTDIEQSIRERDNGPNSP